jgi:parallel beta-helix repeat protein
MPAGWRTGSHARSTAACAAALAFAVIAFMPARADAAAFIPVADTYVDAEVPTAVYGTRTALKTDASPTKNAYLRFNVQGVGPTPSARLRLFATSTNKNGFRIHSVSSNAWSESGTSFGNAPAFGPVVASSGPVTAGNWYSVDVSSLVAGDGLVSFAVTSTSSTGTSYSSREGANPPQLLAPAPPAASGYVVTRDGSTYTATPEGGGLTFTGTLKFAVENAMYDLSSSGGGTITFTAGVFDLGDSWFELRDVSNVTFQGQGMDATVIQNYSSQAADTEPFNTSTTHNLVIRDMQVNAGGPFRSTSDAIDMDGGNDALIERVRINASRSRGIVFDGKDIQNGLPRTADGNVVRSCVITGTEVQGDGIELLGASNNLIEGCTIKDVGGYGIQATTSSSVASQPNKKSTDNVITGNLVDNAGHYGIEIGSSDRNEILGNTILNSGNVSSASGIRLASSDSVGCDDNVVSQNTATDNQTTKTQRYGLYIASSLCRRTVVRSDNNFAGNLSAPIKDAGTGTLYP